MSYSVGGGGGKAADFTENTSYALTKPYELYWPMTPEMIHQINEMLDLLFRNQIRASTDITTLQATTGSSDLLITTKEISSGEVQTLNTTPIAIVTGTVNKIIMPVFFALEKDTTVASSTGPSLLVRYDGVTTDIYNFTGAQADLNNVRTGFMMGVYNTAGTVGNIKIVAYGSTNDIIGENIVLTASGASDGTTTIKTTMAYLLRDAEYTS